MTLHLEKKLIGRKKFGNFRRLQIPSPLIDFASNDYLGLARSPTLASFVMQELHKHGGNLNGLGSTGSRLLTGNSPYVQELEENIAAFHGYQAGLLFGCGYMANVGLLSTVACQEDTIFFDASIHASTHDGIRLSRAHAFAFRHNDLEHLENRLKKHSRQAEIFICIESIYSTDGSQAPLIEICQLAKKYHAHLIVDEAHATGVWGPCGRGLVAQYNLTNEVFAQVTTFGKALGTYGAVVMGSDILKQGLINFATSYIYTTALPFQVLAAIKCSYELFPELKSERKHLCHLIQFFQKAYPCSSMTQIQSIPIKGNLKIKKVAKQLKEQGFDLRPLLNPTVRQGQEILRICLHAFNTEEQLHALINSLDQIGDLNDA